MDLVTENWSEVAREAFERQLNLHKFKNATTIEKVVERLRASKAAQERDDELQGRTDGQNWALKYASYRDLKRIANLDLDETEGGYASQFDRALGRSGTDWGASFWNDGDFQTAPANAYVEGFTDGAREVWEQVEGKI